MNNPMPTSTKPKTNVWLWIILIVVVLVAAGYFGWLYWGNKSTPAPVASPSPADELTSLENDLQKVDSDFEELDKIDASEDEAPTL